jgi:hypothetical protein
VLCKLQDHVDAAVLTEGIPECHTMRVVQAGVQTYLSLNELELGFGGYIGEVNLHANRTTTFTA